MLAIVWHGRTGASDALARAAKNGAGGLARKMVAGDVQPEDLLAAAGFLFICPENLAAMSGAMKEMFDRCYYPLLGQVGGRPYATIIAAGSDGSGAQAQIDRICTGWRLRRVAEPMLVVTGAQTLEAIAAPKRVDPHALQAASELGSALTQGLAIGVF